MNNSDGHLPPGSGNPPSTVSSTELHRTIASPGGLSDIAPQLPQIEGYEVLEEIGRGSNGVVYRARQRAAGSRVVALKVMLGEAFAGTTDLRRFEREVEIASDLNHPNIARIYDSGLAHGRHYFAMEYVDGQALDEFCKSRNLPLKDRLRLFTAVCEAVAFAHRRGVIHRDLKPSNIKVSDEGIPYVLDFGLAKTQSTAEDAELRSMLTMDGLILGTLPYMAPEQAEGKSSAIDTRTDVYALGVILYELLTGKFPYEVTGQMAEVLKRIAESEPNRPSTDNRLIGDEVETIILRALQKLPDRRYSGADDLARDVTHFLAGEPIEAKRDSGLYVLRKTMRRYRVPLAFAAAMGVLVCGFAAVSFSLYRGAERARTGEAQQRRLVEEQRDRALKAEQVARTSEQVATHERDKAQAAEKATTEERDKAQDALRKMQTAQEAERTAKAEAEHARTVAGTEKLTLANEKQAATQLAGKQEKEASRRLARQHFNEGVNRWFDRHEAAAAAAYFAEAIRVSPEPFPAARLALKNALRECPQMRIPHLRALP